MAKGLSLLGLPIISGAWKLKPLSDAGLLTRAGRHSGDLFHFAKR
jgi:hypothetical protein